MGYPTPIGRGRNELRCCRVRNSTKELPGTIIFWGGDDRRLMTVPQSANRRHHSVDHVEFGNIENSDARPYLTQNLSRLVENIY